MAGIELVSNHFLMAASVPKPRYPPEPKSPMTVPRITVSRNPTGISKPATSGAPVPKSPDGLTSMVARKSITSMSEEEIIQENLNEILDLKSRVSFLCSVDHIFFQWSWTDCDNIEIRKENVFNIFLKLI